MSKRMFSANIIESDAFLDMPLSAQALYMHLNMGADNDGFVQPKRILRMVGGNEDDLRILVGKRFLLIFEGGVAVIKHWWINNTKRGDRHTPTTYQKELAELKIGDNKSYTFITTQMALETEVGNQVETKRQPAVASMQLNAAQSNAKQTNAIQPTATKPETRDLKNPKNRKRTYHDAVVDDEALSKKEAGARTRKSTGKTTRSVSQIFGGTA